MCSRTAVVKTAKAVAAAVVAAAKERPLWRLAPQRELIGKKFFLRKYIDNLLYKVSDLKSTQTSKNKG